MKEAVIAKLTAPDSPLRRRGLEIIMEFLLDRPVQELVNFEETRDIVLRALTVDNLSRIVDRHVKPSWNRYRDTVRSSTESVGSLVPDEARQQIRSAIGRSRLPKSKWVHGAVDPALIRQLFAPVFTDVLVNFAKRIPLPGASAGAAAASSAVGRDVGGIAGRLGRTVQKRAEKLVDASRSVMGGLGVEMERRIQATAKEFSGGAVNIWRDALRERLKSPEGKELLGQISQQITDHVMMTQLCDIHEDILKQPIEEFLDTVPPIVAHAARRSFVKGIVDTEVAAFAATEGHRCLREVLTELGILERVVSASVTRFDAIAKELLSTPAFAEWLGELLNE